MGFIEEFDFKPLLIGVLLIIVGFFVGKIARSLVSEQQTMASQEYQPATPSSLQANEMPKVELSSSVQAEPEQPSTVVESAPQQTPSATVERRLVPLDYQPSQTVKQAIPFEKLDPFIQGQIPEIFYEQHHFDNEQQENSWVQLNGAKIALNGQHKGIRVLEITPSESVLDYNGYIFKLSANM